LKILTVVNSLGLGGTERTAQTFAEAYKRLNNDSKVLYLDIYNDREERLMNQGIECYKFVNEDNIYKIITWNPDLIHIHSHGITDTDLKNLNFLFNRKYKIVEQNVFAYPSNLSLKVNTSYQLSNWCLWQFTNRSNNKLPISTAIIPNATDINAFKRANDLNILNFKNENKIDISKIIIGRVGQPYIGKWSTRLIDIFYDLIKIKSNIHLLLVLPPIEIKERINFLNLNNHVTILERIQGDDNLSIIYSAIDIFTHITEQGESFGNVLAESMLCETPILTLSTPWGDNSQCEVVGHLIGGCVCLSVTAFKSTLLMLIKDSKFRIELGKNARKRIINEFDSNLVANLSIKLALFENRDLFSKSQLSNKIISIYKDAYGKPSKFIIILLRFNVLLGLTKYISGYEPWTSFYNNIIKKFKSFFYA
jgi:glycosyltransferase involved in cell wall biosynthesis